MAKGYRFTVSGQYYGGSHRDKHIRSYGPELFTLPEIVEYVSGRKMEDVVQSDGRIGKKSVPVRTKVNALRVAQHILMRFHLPPRLRDSLEDFQGVRTMHIIKKERITLSAKFMRSLSDTPISDMTESELLQFHTLHDLNTALDTYGSLADKKIAVEQEFKQVQAAAKNRKRTSAEHALTEPPSDVLVSSGAVTSADGVPTDEEDPSLSLL